MLFFSFREKTKKSVKLFPTYIYRSNELFATLYALSQLDPDIKLRRFKSQVQLCGQSTEVS